MPAGLNSTELNDIAPAWVNEPNGRGLHSSSTEDLIKLKVLRNMENHN